jgi:hypothetical protein
MPIIVMTLTATAPRKPMPRIIAFTYRHGGAASFPRVC